MQQTVPVIIFGPFSLFLLLSLSVFLFLQQDKKNVMLIQGILNMNCMIESLSLYYMIYCTVHCSKLLIPLITLLVIQLPLKFFV
jgi:hypothetical protein